MLAQIDLPCWAYAVTVTGGSAAIRYALCPDSEVTGVPTLLNNVFVAANGNHIQGLWNRTPIPFRTLTIYDQLLRPFVNIAMAALLTDVPRDAMPPLQVDVANWATFNGPSNDPT